MKSLLMSILLLGFYGVAHGQTAIDQLESDDYGFALNCHGELLSSVRTNWQNIFNKMPIGNTSLYQAREYYAKYGLDYDVPVTRIQEDVDWQEGIQVVNENLGLPLKLNGCDVEVVWLDYGKLTNGPKRLIGRKEYWSKLNFIDLFLVFLPMEHRLSTSATAVNFSRLKVR